MGNTITERPWLLLGAISCCVVILWACESEKPTEPQPAVRPVESPHGIFVASNGNGAGSPDAPFGTIQAALDSAGQSDSRDTIYVATGLYRESLALHSPVVIVGGRDRYSNWQKAEYGSTSILGDVIFDVTVAVLVTDITDTVELHCLDITAANAVDSGGSSVGVICSNVSLLILNECQIRSRNGVAGTNGTKGDYGADGVMLDSPIFMGGQGGGGAWPCAYCLGQPGSPGYCADGTASGGAGGSAVWVEGMGRDGYPGPEGAAGTDGGAAPSVPIVEIVDGVVRLCPSVGGAGTAGSPGCGGGGGAGSPTWSIFTHTNGPEYTGGLSGGEGGCGGGGGFGGTGGTSGGCSVALLVYMSSVETNATVCYTMGGGAGGAGGSGGAGGAGAPGYPPSETDNIGTGPQAGDGGAGGNGGRGGHGAGGAGGSSIGILACLSTVTGIDSSLVSPGSPGAGGASFGTVGEDGLRLIYLNITE